MNKVWSDNAWEDYLYWQDEDRKTLRRINKLINDINAHPFTGIGKPEPLKHQWQGYWSRRIDDDGNRIIYRIKNKQIEIAQCRAHYDD